MLSVSPDSAVVHVVLIGLGLLVLGGLLSTGLKKNSLSQGSQNHLCFLFFPTGICDLVFLIPIHKVEETPLVSEPPLFPYMK